jgi:hypothetical protein
MLKNAVQSSGGAARDRRLNDWEKAFVAMLGGSKRPITKDRTHSPEQVASELKQEGVKTPIPWSAYWAVGLKGQLVPSTLSKPELTKRIREIGAIAGVVGIIIFNKSWRTYTRRFLLDPLAQERLDAAEKFFAEHLKNFEAEELKRRSKDASESLLSAQVYLDPSGDTFSMFYSFHPDHFPETGSRRVGSVYLVNAQKSHGRYQAHGVPWLVRWHSEEPRNRKYAEILEHAKERFNEVVKKLHEIQVAGVP